MKKLIHYLALILIAVSCQKVIPLDAETKTPKLVVNSLFSSEKRWEVNVSRSLSVIDEGDLIDIDNATVSIFDNANDALVTSLVYAGEDYISLGSLKPDIGKEYRIEVSAPDYTSVTSYDKCPNNVPILSVDTSSTISSFGENLHTISLNFKDPTGNNYYGIQLDVLSFSRNFNSSTGTYDTIQTGGSEIYISSTNPIVDNGGPESYAETLTFKDNLFDGQSQTITFDYYFYETGNPNEFFVRKIRLLSLTEATYKFLKSIEVYRSVEGNPFAEPVQVFSNIENGFGIFGGQSKYELEY